MRDVETFTEIYYKELRRTPTGNNPVIRRFMERWSAEEAEHGELLNRFLAEAGFPVGTNWQAAAKAAIPVRYTVENYLAGMLTNCFGRYFSGTHMVWGAINELTTLQGYRRLWQLAAHPVLEYLLRAIAREESAHANFYWHIARLHLERSTYARRLARFTISNFWTPVGQGAKPQHETNRLIRTLFEGRPGVSFFERTVSRRIKQLPGLDGLNTISETIAGIALDEEAPEHILAGNWMNAPSGG
ncbi:MAG: acyl-ACP desaturase [Acidobacteria bacterium]|nr:acyl-ACP desaturase [Acidobacteriota bacterium]